MHRFDLQMQANGDTFYCSRYVDDIVIITSARENRICFVDSVKKALPHGLRLNADKSQIVEAKTKVIPVKVAPGQLLFSFEYLGYKFSVSEPVAKKSSDVRRSVTVDIAGRKVKKIKTRIVRSFYDFNRNHDWDLLRDRISFLTQNFSVYNPKAGGKKLAGIYHSYPLVTEDADALRELDRFLRNAILSATGRVFSKTSALLNGSQRRNLLKYSFTRGHADRSFVHFSALRISEIQGCWMN